MADEVHLAEFYELGFERLVPISSAHGDGVASLIGEIDKSLSHELLANRFFEEKKETDAETISLAVIGRPNVGKSTTINKLLGEDRVVTCNMPGTTRDTLKIPFTWERGKFNLVDTAGIRKRTKISDMLEKFAVIKTLETIRQSNVVILLLDGTQGVTDQDLHIASMVQLAGCALVVGVNKWDDVNLVEKSSFKIEVGRKLRFLYWVKIHFFSALKGFGLKEIMGVRANGIQSFFD